MSVLTINEKSFESEVVNSELPVLIDFWAEWCDPCKEIALILDEINKYFVPTMQKQGYGNIIHVGSLVGSEAKGSVPYNTAKAALSGYVRTLGKELIKTGIIVAGIVPGAFIGDSNAMSRFRFYKPKLENISIRFLEKK